jgi:hypothetical protein
VCTAWIWNNSKHDYVVSIAPSTADIPLLDASDNPELEADGVTQKVHPDAGKDWCFAYGENEWMSGKNWTQVKTDAAPLDENGDIKSRIGNIACL